MREYEESLGVLVSVRTSEAQKMEDMLNLKTIERVTSEVLRSLKYKDYDLGIEWIRK
ncbi:MAG: hypothetical protein Q8O03_02350 [Nanoarchaeota archaeon]|nr:hypothetical protein [Nanoarchaeota archaeon]